MPGTWAKEEETASTDAETKDKSVFMGNGMIIVCKIRILNQTSMTASFESIVKSENSLPEDTENQSWGFPWCNSPCHGKKGTDRRSDRNEGILQIKGKRSVTTSKVVLPSMTKPERKGALGS